MEALKQKLMDNQILQAVYHSLQDCYMEIRQRAYMALGHYIKNGLSLSHSFFKIRENLNSNVFNIVFQGSIGEGHGIEEVINVLGYNSDIKNR